MPSSAEPALLVVFGPGGAGKGTLARNAVASDARLWLSRSWTTRPRRPTESAEDYVFTDEQSFRARIEAGGFLEWAEFLGHLYGTPTPTPPPGANVLLEIDLVGARQVLEAVPDACLVLVVPPTEAHQVERLRGRGDEEAHVAARVARGREEVREGREIAQHVLVNDDLATSTAELLSILAGLREARARAKDERT